MWMSSYPVAQESELSFYVSRDRIFKMKAFFFLH